MVVKELWCYPVKSLGGYSVPEAQLTPRGFADDRRWMLVDDRGQFYTQRDYPHFAEWIAHCEGDRLSIRHRRYADRQLVLPQARPETGSLLNVSIWEDTVAALAVSDQADRWLSTHLGIACRLVYMPPQSVRPIDPDYAQPGEVVSFADGFPFLITNTASLRELSRRLGRPISMNRFRPNIVIEAAAPFAEDDWQQLRIGRELFRLPKPCGRCQVVTVDQETGEKSPDVLSELARFRKRGNKVIFGMNACWDKPTATPAPAYLRVGDTVARLGG